MNLNMALTSRLLVQTGHSMVCQDLVLTHSEIKIDLETLTLNSQIYSLDILTMINLQMTIGTRSVALSRQEMRILTAQPPITMTLTVLATKKWLRTEAKHLELEPNRSHQQQFNLKTLWCSPKPLFPSSLWTHRKTVILTTVHLPLNPSNPFTNLRLRFNPNKLIRNNLSIRLSSPSTPSSLSITNSAIWATLPTIVTLVTYSALLSPVESYTTVACITYAPIPSLTAGAITISTPDY